MAEQILDNEELFNRIVKVETVYHLSQMYLCGPPYLTVFERCDNPVYKSKGINAWMSTVYEDSGIVITKQDPGMKALY